MCKFEVIEVDGQVVTYSIMEEFERVHDAAAARFCMFEIGNHGDISVINPFSNKRLWVGASFDQPIDLYAAMRRVMEVAEKIHFLGDPVVNN